MCTFVLFIICKKGLVYALNLDHRLIDLLTVVKSVVSVLHTSDVNAISPNDYNGQPTGVTLSFQPGDGEKTHSIVIKDDQLIEGPECFEIQLQDPDIGDLGTPHAATATITDDDCK